MELARRLRRHPYVLGSIALLIVMVGGGILALSGPWRSTAGAQGGVPAPPRVPVVSAAARTHDIGVYLNGLGAVTPLNTVTVKSRVDGELIAVRFQEGQIVSSGELLAEIDPRPFEAQLTQFEGQLERDQALLDNARLDLKRFQELVWNTIAIPDAGPLTGWPRYRMRPDVGRERPAISRKSVDLPDPDRPRRPTICPSVTARSQALPSSPG